MKITHCDNLHISADERNIYLLVDHPYKYVVKASMHAIRSSQSLLTSNYCIDNCEEEHIVFIQVIYFKAVQIG